MVRNGTPTKAWIFRKGNGQLRVHPSPVILNSGETFTMGNLSGALASVTFPENTVVGPDGVQVRIADKYSPDLRVVAKEPIYFEYDVVAGGQYADGGSKPGGIVDP
jgi:hypothetical protein